MTTPNELQLNDIGTILQIVIKNKRTKDAIDLSTCTSKTILLKKPSGDVVERPASFSIDGVNGTIHYITVDGDLDEVGSWGMQAHIAFASQDWHTNASTFKVLANLE
jgi:hypothetical protein